MNYVLTEPQRRALLHLGVGQQRQRSGKLWYPSKGTYAVLTRMGLVTTMGEDVVLTAEGYAEARASIPL